MDLSLPYSLLCRPSDEDSFSVYVPWPCLFSKHINIQPDEEIFCISLDADIFYFVGNVRVDLAPMLLITWGY